MEKKEKEKKNAKQQQELVTPGISPGRSHAFVARFPLTCRTFWNCDSTRS